MHDIICDIRAVLRCSAEEANEFCLGFRHQGVNVQESFVFEAELLLREALTNAVVHGSAGDPNKQVFCAVRLARSRVVIAVRDEGEGFDWRAGLSLPPCPLATNGRGLEIFRKYASQVRFNTRGNAVFLIKHFGN